MYVTGNVEVPFTLLSSKWRKIIMEMVETPKGISFSHEFHGEKVFVKLSSILFHKGYAHVTFNKSGSLKTSYEHVMIKERIRQLFDTRHY